MQVKNLIFFEYVCEFCAGQILQLTSLGQDTTGNTALLFGKGHISAETHSDFLTGTVTANVIWVTRGDAMYYLFFPFHVGL